MRSPCSTSTWEHYDTYCNAANNDSQEDENVSELAIHYMKENGA